MENMEELRVAITVDHLDGLVWFKQLCSHAVDNNLLSYAKHGGRSKQLHGLEFPQI